jgi:hypothetical protein
MLVMFLYPHSYSGDDDDNNTYIVKNRFNIIFLTCN